MPLDEAKQLRLMGLSKLSKVDYKLSRAIDLWGEIPFLEIQFL